ncbi:hydrolase, partial [Streptomyces sp. NRRL F-6602]
LLTLPDAGHVAMMEYPDEVAAAVRELLADAGEALPPVSRRSTGSAAATADEVSPADGAGDPSQGS